MKSAPNLVALCMFTCQVVSPFTTLAAAEEKTIVSENKDMLRFSNYDTLHGSFQGFDAKGALKWQTPESPDPILFSTKKLHRILLNQGMAHASLAYTSSVHLINGDIIPGTITSATQTAVTLDSQHLGSLTIPRNSIKQLNPSPFGGKLFYFGPLNTEGWKTSAPKPKTTPKKEKEEPTDKAPAKLEPEENKPSDWKYISNAWYAGTDKSRYLVRENALPDQCKLSFTIGWRGSLHANVHLHADFSPPQAKDEELKPSHHSTSFPGRSYKLTLSSNTASLSSISFDENGKPQTNHFNQTRVSLPLNGKDETHIELRLDRTNRSIHLYCDGAFRGKWNLGENYDGKGNHLAFSRSIHYNNSKTRISNIAISDWNGMKDSAQSMSTTKRDIILLNNGVDRFSGTFKNILDGKVHFLGTYQNEMSIPVDEIQQIHLATDDQASPPEETKEAVYFFVYPYGRITGIPSASEQGHTKLSSDLLGDLELNTSFINIIDFSHKNSLLDLWDDHF